MNDDNKPMYIFASVLIIGFAIIGHGCQVVDYESIAGTVIERQFTNAETNINVGISGSGDPVVVNSSTPERWAVIVQAQEDIIPVLCTKKEWAKLDKGSAISIKRGIRRWFGRKDWEVAY